MHWTSKSWILISVLLAAFTATARAQIATTTVADTVYHADGTPATGTVIVNWPAFTTSNGDAIPSGSTSATIAANGALSVQLVSNAGATPIGSYYTVIYHLDDGSVSRQYWIVPASAAPVQVSAIESTVLPTSVAMQTVSKSYVDTAIAAAVTGHPLDSTPYLLKAGDTMTGPLVLPADPVSAMQSADKNYVDASIAAVAGGLGQKLSMGGDIGGTAAAPVVTGIQGNPVSATAPAAGQALTWNGSAYTPATPNTANLASPPAIGNSTGAPSLAVAANNYPATGWDTYTAINDSCTQTLLPADNGSSYPSSFCESLNYNDWYPGLDQGSSWYLPYAFGLNVNSTSDGIRVADQIVGTYTGSGDTVLLNLTANSKEAIISGSTEGFHMLRQQLTELGDFYGTIATGGTGATALRLTETSGGGSLGLNSPFIDLNSAQSCTIANTGVTTGAFGGTIATATTSCALPVSHTGTLAGAVTVPRLAPNTTGQLSHSAQTVTLNTTADLSLLPSPIVCGIIGPQFYETIGNTASTPLSFGTYNSTAHTQTVTANFYYSHAAGMPFFCGGAVGDYFDQASLDPAGTGSIYLLRIYGSPTANSVWIGNEVAAGFSGSNLIGGAGTIYKGADVIGVIDPSLGTPDWGYVAIEPNTASWTAGDGFANTNNISANYYSYYDNTNVDNPFATRVMHYENWLGYGGGAGAQSGWLDFINNPPDTNYAGIGGKYQAPYLIAASGIISAGLTSQYAPVSGGLNINGCPQGFMLAICNGPAPGAASTLEGILSVDSGSITYDHATSIFNVETRNGSGGGFTYNGQPICAGSCNVAVPLTMNEVNNGAPVLTLMSYNDGDNNLAGGLVLGETAYGGGSPKPVASLQLYGEPGHYGAAPGVALTIDNWQGPTPVPLLYGSGYDASPENTLSLENGYTPCPKLLCLGPGATMDGSGNQTTNSETTQAVTSAMYLGPATAPTGSCPANGAWVFSQDGHVTFCAAGTWTTKI